MKRSHLLNTLLTTLKKLPVKGLMPQNVTDRFSHLSIHNRYAQAVYLFILVEMLFLIVLAIGNENKTQNYLEQKTAEAQSAYETVHYGFYKLSKIVSDSIAKDKKVVDLLEEAATTDGETRVVIGEEIEEHLQEDFFNLKELYFQEIKFVLPNNYSLLHLNVSGQQGIYQKEASEDAELKGINPDPFRFTHPLVNKENNVVSSIEFSLLPSVLTKELGSLLETQLHFVKTSQIPVLLQIEEGKKTSGNGVKRPQYLFDQGTMADIALQTDNAKSFSMAMEDQENIGTVTFMAVKRGEPKESVDYLVYFEDDPKLAVLAGKYNMIQLSGMLLIAGIFIFAMIMINRKKEIEIHVNEKTQELQETNQLLRERYELTFAGVGDGVWDWDLINDRVYFSKRWKEMLGYEEDEIENSFEEWRKRVHPDDLEQVMIDVTENMAGKTDRLENLHRLRHKDGRWIWILDRGQTIFDDEGKSIRMLGTHTDVTEKKALEDRVAENEAKLIDAQKIAHLGNWEWNLSDDKISCSDELYRLLGEEPQSFVPSYRTLVSYLPTVERAEYRENLRKVLRGTDPDYSYEWKILKKDGSVGYAYVALKVIYDERGRIVKVTGTFLDVTERKEAEEKLSTLNRMLVDSYNKQKIKTKEISEAKKKLEISHSKIMAAKAEAEQASRSKSEFLANMSHEIRTPLNAINGFISLLKESETDKEKLSYLNIVNNSSSSLLQIINDILDFSRIESGKLIIEELDFDPKKELIGMSDLFKLKAVEKDIRLYIDVCEKLPATLHGDVLRLKQIFSNLLSNAIKFTEDRGTIVCKVAYEEGRLFLDVKDNGIGIPEEKKTVIFESFTQADGSTVRKYGGTGLGLAISANLAKLLGGELKVESKEGVGSRFFFSAPFSSVQEKDNDEKKTEKVEVEESTEVSVEAVEEKVKGLKGHTLVVEDNEANQMFIGIVLRGAGLTYDTANNGLEAIEMFRSGKYELILMDENMPKLNGIGATKEILQIERDEGLEHTPIMALTANALVGDRQIFLDAGMDDYLAKPLEPAVLLEKIEALIAY